MRKFRLSTPGKGVVWRVVAALAVFGLVGAAGSNLSGSAQAQNGGGAGEGPGATVIIGDATAEAGAEAAVTVSLETDVPAAAVQVDILYNGDEASIGNPAAACALDGRLSGGQSLSASFPAEQPEAPTVRLRLGVFPPLVFPNPTFDSGAVVTCRFVVSSELEAGATIPLVADRVQVAVDDVVICNPGVCGEVDGLITVGDGQEATPTPTATSSEDTPTPGVTDTPVPPTNTPGVPSCSRDSDCPTGTTCQNNMCRPVDCNNDQDCPPGSECRIEGTPPGQCVPIDCTNDQDCPDRSFCDENGMCRPRYCNGRADCRPGEVCADDGICSPTCTNDGQCSPEVCVDGSCVECRDDTQCPGGVCIDNSCTSVETTFAMAVSPASQVGVAGSTVSVEVVLSSNPAGAAAESASNALDAAAGLTLTACTVAAEIPGVIAGVPGSTVSATLGGASGSVPSGTLYSCSVAIAAGISGARDIGCSAAVVNGTAVTCTGATIQVQDGELPTPTPTAQPTATNTPIPPTPTNTPTNTPRRSSDDDGCTVAPVSSTANPVRTLLVLLLPAAFLWYRRRR